MERWRDGVRERGSEGEMERGGPSCAKASEDREGGSVDFF